jgi:hypothetical protein
MGEEQMMPKIYEGGRLLAGTTGKTKTKRSVAADQSRLVGK